MKPTISTKLLFYRIILVCFSKKALLIDVLAPPHWQKNRYNLQKIWKIWELEQILGGGGRGRRGRGRRGAPKWKSAPRAPKTLATPLRDTCPKKKFPRIYLHCGGIIWWQYSYQLTYVCLYKQLLSANFCTLPRFGGALLILLQRFRDFVRERLISVSYIYIYILKLKFDYKLHCRNWSNLVSSPKTIHPLRQNFIPRMITSGT